MRELVMRPAASVAMWKLTMRTPGVLWARRTEPLLICQPVSRGTTSSLQFRLGGSGDAVVNCACTRPPTGSVTQLPPPQGGWKLVTLS
jgi:hypothetical protein